MKGGNQRLAQWDKRASATRIVYGEDRKQARERAISKIVFYSFL